MSAIAEHIDLIESITYFEKMGFVVELSAVGIRVRNPEMKMHSVDMDLASQSVKEFQAMAKAFKLGYTHGIDMEQLRSSR